MESGDSSPHSIDSIDLPRAPHQPVPVNLGTLARVRRLLPSLAVATTLSLAAAESPGPAPLQQQIDELKAGQQRLSEELQTIRKLLQDTPSRADYGARPQFPGVLNLGVRGEPFQGATNARFAIVEYSDFDCSHCARYAREIFPRLEQDFLKTGKLKYFFGDLPDPAGTNSIYKARAARCASEQEKFWPMHDALVAHVDEPPEESVLASARTAGLDLEKLKACLQSGRYDEEIRRSLGPARRNGLIGTPAFLIGTLNATGDAVRATRLVVGAETYEPLKEAIDSVLMEGLPSVPVVPAALVQPADK